MDYLNFFFAEEYYGVSSSDGDGCDSTGFDSLESILYLIESALVAENGDIVFGSLA
jgi:hypothetical protein